MLQILIFDENFEVLHTADKSRKLKLLETLEINYSRSACKLLNDQLDLNNSPLLNMLIEGFVTPTLYIRETIFETFWFSIF